MVSMCIPWWVATSEMLHSVPCAVLYGATPLVTPVLEFGRPIHVVHARDDAYAWVCHGQQFPNLVLQLAVDITRWRKWRIDYAVLGGMMEADAVNVDEE